RVDRAHQLPNLHARLDLERPCFGELTFRNAANVPSRLADRTQKVWAHAANCIAHVLLRNPKCSLSESEAIQSPGPGKQSGIAAPFNVSHDSFGHAQRLRIVARSRRQKSLFFHGSQL